MEPVPVYCTERRRPVPIAVVTAFNTAPASVDEDCCAAASITTNMVAATMTASIRFMATSLEIANPKVQIRNPNSLFGIWDLGFGTWVLGVIEERPARRRDHPVRPARPGCAPAPDRGRGRKSRSRKSADSE